MRRPLIAANWKMHLGRADDALALVRRIRPALSRIEQIEIAICPPFTVLSALADVLRSSPIALGGQNMHPESQGAHTGEISPLMLAEFDQQGALVPILTRTSVDAAWRYHGEPAFMAQLSQRGIPFDPTTLASLANS